MHVLRWECLEHATSVQLIVMYRQGHVYPIGLTLDGSPFPGADGYISALGADSYLYEPQGMIESFMRERLDIVKKQRVILKIPLSVGRLISDHLATQTLH